MNKQENNMEYIATFYIHYSAIKFARDMNKKGYTANPVPVPRQISSSCGTCVQFTIDESENVPTVIADMADENVEAIFCKQENNYNRIHF